MHGVRVCANGPTFAVRLGSGLVKTATSLSDECKVSVLRAVGVVVAKNQLFHPNLIVLFTFAKREIIDGPALKSIEVDAAATTAAATTAAGTSAEEDPPAGKKSKKKKKPEPNGGRPIRGGLDLAWDLPPGE